MQVVLQDRLDRAVGQRTDLGGAFAGGLDGLMPMRADKPDNAEAGAETLFRVGLGMQDLLHQRSGVRANSCGTAADLAWRDAGMATMAGGHVLGHGGVPAVARAPDMGRNTFAVVINLDGAGGEARPERLLEKLMRDRVVMLLDLDMVVEADAALEYPS